MIDTATLSPCACPPMASTRPLRTTLLALLAAGTTLTAPLGRTQPIPQLDLPRTELRAGMHRIDAQVASRPPERQIGLMQRQSMPQHEGMLFVFERAGIQCFWMKNTPLPLTAAFIADDGRITNLADMQPLDEQSHCSSEPVRFVLEMNQGWFRSKGIQAGQRLHGPMFRP